jgi:hypothetical protein
LRDCPTTAAFGEIFADSCFREPDKKTPPLPWWEGIKGRGITPTLILPLEGEEIFFERLWKLRPLVGEHY